MVTFILLIKIKIGQGKEIRVERQRNQIFLNGNLADYEVIKITDSSYKVYNEHKVFRVGVVSRRGEKEIMLNINDQTVEVKVTDHIDHILEKMGMNTVKLNMVNDIKAPMHGVILNILVEEGATVQKGDQLLVLEAMKMENVIKSPREGVVSKIHVVEKTSAEKNQILISFKK